jgi:hypothetical protein
MTPWDLIAVRERFGALGITDAKQTGRLGSQGIPLEEFLLRRAAAWLPVRRRDR